MHLTSGRPRQSHGDRASAQVRREKVSETGALVNGHTQERARHAGHSAADGLRRKEEEMSQAITRLAPIGGPRLARGVLENHAPNSDSGDLQSLRLSTCPTLVQIS